MSTRTKSLAILIYGFVLLGMPGAALGVAWPSMADDLSRNLGDLGILTIMTGAAYSLVSLVSGSLSKRFRAGGLLVVAAITAAASMVMYAFGDGWYWYVAASIPLGISSGLIDSIGNAYVAVKRGPRAMGLIHAGFGFGAMVAPLMVTALLAAGISWRVGFGALAAAELVLAIAFLTIASVVRMPMEGRTDRPKRLGSMRVLGGSIWVFFIYAAVEGSTGLWAFTLLSEGQGLSTTAAGLAVAAHWGGIFLTRLMIGIWGDRLPPDRTITISVVGMAVGMALLWWNPVSWVAVFGLVLAGFASGPVFPIEVLLNPVRFGEDFTPWAVGYQLSAVTAAFAVVPAAIGLLINAHGPLIIAPVLFGLAIVMAVSAEALRFISIAEPS